jgi:hypothetical protein
LHCVRQKLANSSHFPIVGERLCMDSSSFASTLIFGDEVRLLTYIRSLFRASQHATLMGFRAPAPYCFIVLRST